LRWRSKRRVVLRENRVDDACGLHVGEALVAIVVAVREAAEVEAEETQNRGMEVRDGDHILHGAITELVGFAAHRPATHSAARDPKAKPALMVIATVLTLRKWRASELARPYDERLVE